MINQVDINDPMLPQLYKITEAIQETADTFTFAIEAANGADCKFAPGQFNMLYAFGVGEVPISISGDPAKQQSFVHTIRLVGTVTSAMSKLKRDDCIGVRGPFGSWWPLDQAQGKDVLIVAGGIGFAPVRPILYHIFAHRQQYNNVALLVGFRTPQDILFHSQLQEWCGKFEIMDTKITVDAATRDWHGQVGVVTTLISRVDFDPGNTIAMMCGPEVMMRFTIRELQNRAVPIENIYVSMERNMKCAIGFCGHCQYGPNFICKDGPVFSLSQIQQWFGKREI